MKQEELDEMLKEAPGPINFTIFLTMFGEKLKGEARQYRLEMSGGLESAVWVWIWRFSLYPGADPEETILNAFKVFDPEGKGVLRKD